MNGLANILSGNRVNQLNLLAGDAYYRLSVARALTMQKQADKMRMLQGLGALNAVGQECPSTGTLIGITLLGYVLLLGVPFIAYKAGKFAGRKLFAQ